MVRASGANVATAAHCKSLRGACAQWEVPDAAAAVWLVLPVLDAGGFLYETKATAISTPSNSSSSFGQLKHQQ